MGSVANTPLTSCDLMTSAFLGENRDSFQSQADSFHRVRVLLCPRGPDDEYYYKQLRLFRNMGREELGTYNYTELGYNYRMNEIQAIIASEQLLILDRMINLRRCIASVYDDTNIPHQKILGKSGYYAYIIKGEEPVGIPHSPMFNTMYKNLIYKKLGITGDCPVSESLANSTWTVPLHAGMKPNEVWEVEKWMNMLTK